MDQVLELLVLGVLAIAAAAVASRRVGVASPLLLLGLGAVVGLLPFVPTVAVQPEWILAGVLPPLLYSAAVSMPAMEFRRELRAISGMSVVLVVASALVLGWFFTLVVPGLSFAWGVALGAIMSPTDAVATSIVKRIGVSPRVVAILEGEGLLNDATALVLLRAATVAAATSWSVGGVVRDFVVAAVLAGAVGYVVGRANLWVRARTPEAAVATAVSLTVPFAASVPAERLEASGLVAAVVAGLVTGRGAPRVLSPQARLSDAEVWHTVELLLEGAVFLVMGLELYGLLVDLDEADHRLLPTVLVAFAALAIVLVVRAAYVVPLLLAVHRRAARGAAVRPRVDALRELTEDPDRFAAALTDRPPPRGRLLRWAVEKRRRRLRLEPEHVEQFGTRLRRRLADIDHLVDDPLGPREGAVVVWAGMRGAVTLAAAQTLPSDTPERSLLVFLAFCVAAGSLVLQGATLGLLVRWVRPAGVDTEALARERAQLVEVLRATAERVRRDASEEGVPLLVAVIEAQRDVLLDLAREGTFATASLRAAMAVLDADQIRLELRGKPVEDA
ncbi:sodium:proton antiporter [Nocardioides zeae]|uniref:Sodium:proton antiporter n=1 Tax=Nocardioides imazamoxiresistens TaxID=3231893 RepID=A0ABU3PUI5_9ACTN|nr:sodium:proton antiporter [Nocardioides zeae]MDT9592897.1 sodium:proton antiporter [Nocardioides zeae]